MSAWPSAHRTAFAAVSRETSELEIVTYSGYNANKERCGKNQLYT